MGAAPLMLALGVGQGVMGYAQGMENAKAAKQNAENARKMQEYERNVRDNNIALIRAETERQKGQQELKNQMALGKVVSQMGASGVEVTGTFMDVLGQEVMLGENKVQMLRGQGLRQEFGARNAGDLAIYRQQVAESQYTAQARASRQGAMFSLVMGGLKGAAGFAKHGGEWSSLFGGNNVGTALTQGLSEADYNMGNYYYDFMNTLQ